MEENITEVNYEQVNIQNTNFTEISALRRMMGLLFILLILSTGVLGYLLNNTAQKLAFYERIINPGVTQLEAVDINKEHIRGNKNAKIALIEYSDYDCPFCQRFHEDAKKAMQEREGDVMWVYRHFPITTLHPDAMKKSEASECVAELGGEEKFWSFTDALYERKPAISEMSNLAEQIGVDRAQFDECFASGRHIAKIEEQMAKGAAAGVTGTPGNFVVNLTSEWKKLKLRGAVPAEEVIEYIDLVK